MKLSSNLTRDGLSFWPRHFGLVRFSHGSQATDGRMGLSSNFSREMISLLFWHPRHLYLVFSSSFLLRGRGGSLGLFTDGFIWQWAGNAKWERNDWWNDFFWFFPPSSLGANHDTHTHSVSPNLALIIIFFLFLNGQIPSLLANGNLSFSVDGLCLWKVVNVYPSRLYHDVVCVFCVSY